MNDRLNHALSTLLRELADGTAPDACWILNPGDPGLLASLDRLPASAASAAPPNGGAPICAHTDHLRYGLSLLNAWARGQTNPFANANYSASWKIRRVTDHEWGELRAQLAAEVAEFKQIIAGAPEMDETELTGAIAAVAHLAYHFGAIRQIDRSIRGPAAND